MGNFNRRQFLRMSFLAAGLPTARLVGGSLGDRLADFYGYNNDSTTTQGKKESSVPQTQKDIELPAQKLEDGIYIQYSFNQEKSEIDKNYENLSKVFGNVIQVPFKDKEKSGFRTLLGRYNSIEDALDNTDRIEGVNEVGILESRNGELKWRLKERMQTPATQDNTPLLGMPDSINLVFLEELVSHNNQVRQYNSDHRKQKHEVNEGLMRCILREENPTYNPNEIHYRTFPVKTKSGKIKLVNITDENGNKLYPSAYGLGGMTYSAMKDVGIKLADKKDIFDVRLNLRGAIRYNGLMMDRFNGYKDLVLASYNAGPSLIAKLKRIPQNVQTPRYVARIKEMYRTLGTSNK